MSPHVFRGTFAAISFSFCTEHRGEVCCFGFRFGLFVGHLVCCVSLSARMISGLEAVSDEPQVVQGHHSITVKDA